MQVADRGQGRRTLAGQVVDLVCDVRVEHATLLAVLGAEADAEAVMRRRQLDALLAEIARDRAVPDAFGRPAL